MHISNRKWKLFCANRRGFWSLVMLLVLFFLSLFAEFVANDKPILLKYMGHYYCPALRFYPETKFGGDFKTEADYRDPYLAKKIEANGWMVFPPIRYGYKIGRAHV